MDRWKKERDELIRHLHRQVDDERVLDAMARVPRHMFLPRQHQASAYEDRPLPIGDGQTISAPHMVAIMCQLLDLRPGQRVLEVGAGWGYHAAVLAALVRPGGQVVAIERLGGLAAQARENLRTVGFPEAEVVGGDGTLGWPDLAPYDRISVACAAPAVPPPLFEQLAEGGKMVIPVGEYQQRPGRWKKYTGGTWCSSPL